MAISGGDHHFLPDHRFYLIFVWRNVGGCQCIRIGECLDFDLLYDPRGERGLRNQSGTIGGYRRPVILSHRAVFF